MGIYDIFSMAAKGAEKIPWRWKLLGGAGVGAVIGGVYGDKDTPIGERVGKGALIGTGLSLGASHVLRGAGAIAGAGEKAGSMAIAGKVSEIKALGTKNSWKAFMKPGSLMLGGAVAGAIIAPEGERMKGAAIGAGIGLMAKPVYHGIYKPFSALGSVRGGQTMAMVAAATIAIGAGVAFGKPTPSETGVAMPGVGSTMDYAPMSGNMQDRMVAMNASGDIVLGLNNRKHG